MQVENSLRLHRESEPRPGWRDGRNGAPTIDLTRFTKYSGNIPLNRVRPPRFVLRPSFVEKTRFFFVFR
jgi:hypothetical protein